MDQNFRKRLQKTLYSGELEPDHCPLALTELAVEYFQGLAPHTLNFVDLQSASPITSQDTVSPSSVAMSMMYAKRLQRKRPDYVSTMSSSDLFIISMMMASKYLYDEGVEEEVFNEEWAKNAGLDTDEVNKMEIDFLHAMEWEMFIKKEDFNKAMLSVEKSVALQEGLKRGWFSYTDLDLLLDDTWLNLSAQHMRLHWLQVVAVSSAAYMAGLLMLVGSTVLVTNTVCLSSNMSPSMSSNMSSSLLSLPALHTSTAARSALSHCPLALPASLCPLPAGDHSPLDVSLNSGAGTNETAAEEDESQSNESRLSCPSVVDTILSQLMAVLTLKSHLAQFVYAVSDSYSSQHDPKHERNHSEKKTPYRHSPRHAETNEDPGLDVVSSTTSVMLRLLGMKSAELFNGMCKNCGKQRKCPSSGFLSGTCFSQQTPGCDRCTQCGLEHAWWQEQARRLGMDVRLTCRGRESAESDGGGRELRWRESWERGCEGREGGWRGGGGKECGWPGELCRDEAMTSVRGLFPDVTIGFSTSMPPPVYAT